MVENDKKEVFISYSTKDDALAQFFCSQLEGNGVSCWIAPRDIPPGRNWANAIIAGIEKADIFVLLVSESSLKSEEVEKEIDNANKYKKKMLPVFLHKVELHGLFQYHLSNKQWVNAYDKDEFTRFEDAVSSVLDYLGKESIAQKSATSTVFRSAQRFAQEMNNAHRESLRSLNTIFSVWDEGREKVSLFLPIRLGATGVDIISTFNSASSSIYIYASALFNGDPLRHVLVKIVEDELRQKLAGIKINTKQKRYEFVEFLSEMLPSKIYVTQEECYELYCSHTRVVFSKIIPHLNDLCVYVKKIIGAVDSLEESLRREFPEKDGWRVGAPEGSRLDGLLVNGRISVYKESWQPESDYRSRGLLAITLCSEENFLEDMVFGIQKFEWWHDLGTWQKVLSDAATDLCGPRGSGDESWLWWQSLPDGYRSSGVTVSDYRWADMDGFIKCCLDKFISLKNMTDLLDNACYEIRNLQNKKLESISLERRNDWPGLYMCNAFREIASKYNELYSDGEYLKVDFNVAEGWWQYVNLKLNIDKFDLVVFFGLGKNQMKIEIDSIELPDFETAITQEYIIKNNFKCAEIVCAASEFDGIGVVGWINEFDAFIDKNIGNYIKLLSGLRNHLLIVMSLTKSIEGIFSRLLPEEQGWNVKIEDGVLEPLSHVKITNKRWFNDGIIYSMNVMSQTECFDDLSLVMATSLPKSNDASLKTSRIRGACEAVFGVGEDNLNHGIWARSFDEPFRKTGGRWLDKSILDASRQDLIVYLSSIADGIKRIEPIVTECCR